MSPRASVREQQVYEYAVGVVVPVFCTLVALLARAHLQQADVIMLELLGVVAVATRFGMRVSVVTAVLAVLLFDYVFIEPPFEFSLPDVKSAITCAVMLVVAIVISGLAERAKRAEKHARSREARTSTMYQLTRQLAEAANLERLAGIAVLQLADLWGCPVSLLVPDAGGVLRQIAATAAFDATAEELALARELWSDGEGAGALRPNAVPAPSQPPVRLVPLVGSSRVGVLLLRQTDVEGWSGAEEQELATVCARQVALAIERAVLAESVGRAELATERERVQNALLRSLSHDFRTPLASILGAASSLFEYGEQLPQASRRELLGSVVEESQRLNRLLTNVLSMTRLEAVPGRIKLEVQPLDEIVSSALGHIGQRLAERPVQFTSPEEPLLVAADAVLLEQLVINVVENCLRYTPSGSALEIVVERRGPSVVLSVSDRGPGVHPDSQARLFEKFYRGPESAPSDGGLGLGLAICRAIADAHSGVIEAANRPGGGLSVSLSLACVEHEPYGARSLPALDWNGKEELHR